MLDPETELELVLAAQNGCAKARNDVIEAFMPMVRGQAREMTLRVPQLYDDAYSVGLAGVDHAIDKFNRTKGARFVGYSRLWVRDKIRRLMSYHHTIVKIPANVRTSAWAVYEGAARDKDEYEGSLGCSDIDIDGIDVRNITQDLLSQLGSKHRFIIESLYLNNKTLREVASHLGLTHEGTRHARNLALRNLRRVVKWRGYDRIPPLA